MEEKKNSVLYEKATTVATWIERIVVINILTIICSLGVISFYAAILSAYEMYDDYINKVETKTIRGYFTYFKRNIGKKLIFGGVFALIIVGGILSSRYYVGAIAENNDLMLWVMYIFILIIMFLSIVVVIGSLPILDENPSTKLSLLVRQSLYIAGKYFFRTVLFLALWIIPVISLITIPTIVILSVCTISLILLLQVFLSQKILKYIADISGKESDDNE